MKKILLTLLVLFSLVTPCFAVTAFVCVLKHDAGAGVDYTSLASWEAVVNCNLTTAKVLSHSGIVGTMADNTAVIGLTSGATGTCLHATSTQILITPTLGTFQSGEQIYEVLNTNYVTSTSSPDSVQATAKIDGDWSGGADTTAVTIAGWTTSATQYINIYTTATARHKGVWSASYYRIDPGNDVMALSSTAFFINITGIQFLAHNTTAYRTCLQISANSTSNVQINSNIIRDSGGSDRSYGLSVGPLERYNAPPMKIYNNIVYGFQSVDINLGTWSADSVYSVYNNTVSNTGYGFYSESTYANSTLKNNIVNDCTVYYIGVFNAASTYNITNDTPSAAICFGVAADSGTTDSAAANKLIQSGQNFLTTVKVGMVVKNTTDTTYSYVTAVDSDTQLTLNDDIMANAENYTIYTNMYGNVLFVNEGAGVEDLHLQSTDTVAKDKGANLYADTPAITTDIDGQDRPNSATTFDIGADEYVAAVSGAPFRFWTDSFNEQF